MTVIKGLLFKDLLIFKNYRKNIVFSMITFIILILLGSTTHNLIFAGSSIFILMFGMNGISTFSYDEAAGSDKYLLSLPISRKEIVLSKYLFGFLDAFLSLLLGLFVSITSTLIIKGSIPNIVNDLKYLMLVFTGVTFLLCSDIPCVYKWGVEKGRMQAVIVPVFLILFLGIIGSIILLLFPNLYQKEVLDILLNHAFILGIIINFLMYYFSYLISYHIFKKKDL